MNTFKVHVKDLVLFMNQILLGEKQDQSVISNKMRSRENVQGERKVRYRLSTLSKQELIGKPFYGLKI